MFHSAHYAGIELCPAFAAGEAWQKVFGPVYIYLNSASQGTPYYALWQDAEAQVSVFKSLQNMPKWYSLFKICFQSYHM
jgi:rhamnogalacturonan endolyase